MAAPADPSARSAALVGAEPWNTGWAFHIDNDAILVGRDRQYTGGFALTLSGRRAAAYPFSLDPLLGIINGWIGIDALSEGRDPRRHSIHFGIAAFTPANISASRPLPNARPYASLVLLSNTRQDMVPGERTVFQSSLMIGLLGTGVAQSIQNGFHSIGGRAEARGWDNQISDGGELTAAYFLSRIDTLVYHHERGFGDFQIDRSISASIGFTTGLGVGLGLRWGRFDTPWWSFVPAYTEYISIGTPVSGAIGTVGSERELYVWGALNLRHSFYNALLQGQFRDSAVTYDRDELYLNIAELSLGVTAEIAPDTELTVFLRARTPRIRGVDIPFPAWGGIVLVHTND